MDKLIDICQRHHLLIIEDAAQALGATFNNQKAGSFGLAGCFSFYPAKILGAYGNAGAVVTNDEAVAEKIKLLRNHGMKSKTEFIAYGFTSRLDNLQAAILNVKMNHLQDWISRRQQIAAIYDKGLADLDQIKRPATSDDLHFDVFQNYVLRAERRDQLAQYLKEKGIETLIKDPLPLHHHPLIGLSHFRLPLSEQLAKEVISLPLYPELTDGQIDYVIDQIHSFYQNS